MIQALQGSSRTSPDAARPIAAMRAEPLVSIIIPTYNRCDYLTGAIGSALSQTYRNLEVLVTEDGGPSFAPDIVRSFHDPRLRCQRQAVNVGMARNKRAGYLAARGEFLANLDDDDELEPNFVEKLLPPLLSDLEVVISFGDHYMMRADGSVDPAASDENTRRWKRDRLAPGPHCPFVQIGLLDQSIPTVQAALLRRSSINVEDLDPAAESACDLYLTYLASRSGGKAWYLPERVSRYRVHKGQSTAAGAARDRRGLTFCYEQFARDPALSQHLSVLEWRLSGGRAGLGIELMRHGDLWAARREMLRSLGLRPNLRAICGLMLSVAPSGILRRILGRS